VTFFVWLSAQTGRTDAIGRLASQAIKDKTFPRKSRHLYLFLHYYDLEPENRAAVKKAHAEWRVARRFSKAA
jgi:uncharacterized protein YozE (UPF0346 family)